MGKIKVLIKNEYDYQTFPIVDGMVEVDENELSQVSITKQFDVENKRIIDIVEDNNQESEEILEELDDVEIEDDNQVRTNVME
jgi:ligand-binding sensor protein